RDQRSGNLLAQRHFALLGEETALAQTGIAQELLEPVAAKGARTVLETRRFANGLDQFLVRHGEPKGARPLVHRVAGDQRADRLNVYTHRLRLFIGDRRTGLALQPLQRVLIGETKLVRRDRARADGGDLARPVATERVSRTPKSEREDDDAEHSG